MSYKEDNKTVLEFSINTLRRFLKDESWNLFKVKLTNKMS